MGAPAVLPAAVSWPQGVTHLRSGGVAALLEVTPRRVARWQTLGLITASALTEGGHRRFTREDVEAFLREAATTGRLTAGDIVSCPAWHDGGPVRVLDVTPSGRNRMHVRWQDVAAHGHAKVIATGRNRLVRRLHQGAA
ncbi:MerR family transcriptional regulator [Streptosporangium sp. NBC_01810]|uniref:MerR family transcriptional regulator n=1 Tax=Streptosporangium sp. NBC_01810 TaxID=2975951 RepID=UPI002DD88F58|nr:MerR family transcriptional regulator [Streptosporangium sp. NBC_01810]WSA23766.1 MerR family transcriptional regulator [Streptosporangium sp. NBC_01810]